MEEDIKKVKEQIKLWKENPGIMIQEEKFKIVQAIENLIKGYKGKTKALDKTLQENAKLRLKINKKDAEISELNKVIDKMAEEIYIEYNPHFKTVEEVKEKFREEVENE